MANEGAGGGDRASVFQANKHARDVFAHSTGAGTYRREDRHNVCLSHGW